MTKETSQTKQSSPPCDPAELFDQFGSAVYAYALHMLAKPSQAEEILSETFLRICSRKDQYRSQGSPRAWVFAIAHRLCIDFLRVKARRGNPTVLPDTLVSSQPSPLAVSQQNEQKQIVVEAIEKLPAEQKEVVMLKTYGQLTFRQISDCLGIPLNTALGRMHSAIKLLSRNPSVAKIGTPENEL